MDPIEVVCCIFYDSDGKDIGRFYSVYPYFTGTYGECVAQARRELPDWFRLFPKASHLVYLQDTKDYLHVSIENDRPE